jgi:hypothetical protein
MRKRSIIMISLSVLVLSALLISCASMSKTTESNFKAPVVTLNLVEIPYYTGWWYFAKSVEPTKGDAGDYGAPLAVAYIFDIQNPNSFPVMMDGFKFTIAFDGFDVNTVSSPEVQWIPPGKTNQVRVTAVSDARAALLSLMVTGGFKLKEIGLSPWDQLEKWWRGAKDYNLNIEVKEGSAVFKAGGVTKVAAFAGKFPS